MTTLRSRVERVRWRFMLWREAFANQVHFAQSQHAIGAWTTQNMKDAGRFDRFVDRVSPWQEPFGGYARTRLRRVLYRARYPRQRFVGLLLRVADDMLTPFQYAPGRYEGNTSQLIARWLDEHSEYADDHGGNSEIAGYYMIFGGDFPWGEHAYVTAEDSNGFFAYVEFDSYEDAQRDFGAATMDQPYDDEPLVLDSDGPWAEYDENMLRYMHGDR